MRTPVASKIAFGIAALVNVIRAAPPGTVVHWYPAGHALIEKAYLTAFAWLAQKLSA